MKYFTRLCAYSFQGVLTIHMPKHHWVVIVYFPRFNLLTSQCAMYFGCKQCRESRTILLGILCPFQRRVACVKQMPQSHPTLVNGTLCGIIASRSSGYKLWYTPPQPRDFNFFLKAYLFKPRLVATSTNSWLCVS
jgi:hypothetical protein